MAAHDSAAEEMALEDSEENVMAAENTLQNSAADPDSASDVRSGSSDEEHTPLSSYGRRSTETQTDEPDEERVFPVRRALSDWALVDRRRSTAHIRSERIRRTAQLFEDLAQEQEERQASQTVRRAGRSGLTAAPGAAAALSAAPPLPPEREVLLVPLPAPAADQTRRVDAILALGSGGGHTGGAADSDGEGDEKDEEILWEKVRSKIAARRSKFQRLESQQEQPRLPTPPKYSQSWLSTGSAGRLTNGKQAPPPSKPDGAAVEEQQMTAPAAQSSPTPETTRASVGKYIEQDEEQKVLRSLDSSVLARQKLVARERAREKLINERAQAEGRQNKAMRQRADAQTRLEKTKSKLTRDSVFERKGLEALLLRLGGTIRDETRKIDKLSNQIAEISSDIEGLRRRAAA